MYTLSVVRAYYYRLYPTAAQVRTLGRMMELLRVIYNAALQERRDAYRLQHISITKREQEKSLTEIKRDCPEYKAVHTHLLQDATTRLDRAFGSFFRRIKEGKKPGFPRFKGIGRYRTFMFKDAAHGNGARFVAGGKRIEFSGIGKVKVKIHRPWEGRIKQIGVTLDGDGHWYAIVVCDDVPEKILPKTGETVGVDVGIADFLVTSDGDHVPNPRPLEVAKISVERAQRKVSRRKRGGTNRRKAVALLSKQHAHVRNVRKDFHHKEAVKLVRRYDAIAIEDLNILGLARGWLAKQVHDVAWGGFANITAYKAESAGRELVRVDPRGTTQECSGTLPDGSRCPAIVPKTLKERRHTCSLCGLDIDRDENAAGVVHWRAYAQGPGRGLRVGAAA